MKKTKGASAIFYLFVGVAFIVLFLAIPLPSYNPSSKSWFLDQSIFQRLSGGKPEGVPLYELANNLTTSSITSPLEIKCETDSDCREYIVANQCASFCGNLDESNTQAVAQLNNRRVCDPSQWRRPSLRCGCVAGRCINLN